MAKTSYLSRADSLVFGVDALDPTGPAVTNLRISDERPGRSTGVHWSPLVTSEVVQVREPLTNSPERGRDREAQLQPLAKVVYPTVPWWQSGEIQILYNGRIFSNIPDQSRKCLDLFGFVQICRIRFARLLGNRHRTRSAMNLVSLQD